MKVRIKIEKISKGLTTGFVLSLNPLVQTGIVPADYPVVCYSLTGYSGGGKKLIQTFENSRLSLLPFKS
jgi:N-acetyl-gamma-glutamyl-phosphate reductase